jgi:hypothetical protein
MEQGLLKFAAGTGSAEWPASGLAAATTGFSLFDMTTLLQ